MFVKGGFRDTLVLYFAEYIWSGRMFRWLTPSPYAYSFANYGIGTSEDQKCVCLRLQLHPSFHPDGGEVGKSIENIGRTNFLCHCRSDRPS